MGEVCGGLRELCISIDRALMAFLCISREVVLAEEMESKEELISKIVRLL